MGPWPQYCPYRLADPPLSYQLIALRKSALTAREILPIPGVIRRRHPGCKVGAKVSMTKSSFKLCIPASIGGNVRTLANKMDELEALTRSRSKYGESGIMCFTLSGCPIWYQTPPWLPPASIQSERTNTTGSSKQKVGRLTFFTLDTSLWKSVSGAPTWTFLPSASVCIYLPSTFLHPWNEESLCNFTHTVAAGLQTKHSEAFNIII